MTENIYHRYLELPFEYTKPIEFEKDLENDFITYYSKDKVQQNFLDWIQKHNLKISNVIEGFFTKTNGSIPIHNDTPIKPNENDVCKLNFTWGPANSTTRWWKIKDENKYIEINHDQTDVNKSFEQAGIVPDIECYKCYSADKDDLELVYEAVINKPSLMNVGQLHDTYNPDLENSRWTLSFTLLNMDGSHCTFKQATEIFKASINA